MRSQGPDPILPLPLVDLACSVDQFSHQTVNSNPLPQAAPRSSAPLVTSCSADDLLARPFLLLEVSASDRRTRRSATFSLSVHSHVLSGGRLEGGAMTLSHAADVDGLAIEKVAHVRKAD